MTGDLRRLTLEQIRAFVSVAERQSFTGAARSQMRTQTAITRQIRSAEDILGVRLVLRTRGHVEGLTEAGTRLLPFARKILATVEDAWSSLERPSVRGKIRIGIMDDIDVTWLLRIVTRFKAMHPDCDVSAVSDFSVHLERRLERRDIDVAIIKRLVTDASPAPGITVRREPLVWAAGPGFRWDQDCPLPLVVFHESCIYRQHVMARLDEQKIPHRIAYEGLSYAHVRSAVFAGIGISALAESQLEVGGLQRLGNIGGVALKALDPVEIVMCVVSGREHPALSAFIRETANHML